MAHNQERDEGDCFPFSGGRVGGGVTFPRRLCERGVPLLEMGMGKRTGRARVSGCCLSNSRGVMAAQRHRPAAVVGN